MKAYIDYLTARQNDLVFRIRKLPECQHYRILGNQSWHETIEELIERGLLELTDGYSGSIKFTGMLEISLSFQEL